MLFLNVVYYYYWGFPCGSTGIESACNAGDLGSISGLGDPWRRESNPLQYYGLENSMDCIVHGAAKSRTQLATFTFTTTIDRTNGHHELSFQMFKLVLEKALKK